MRSELSNKIKKMSFRETLFYILVFEAFQTLFLALFALMFTVIF